MLLYLLTTIASGCALFDFFTSYRRLRKYGLGAEKNPVTRWISSLVGLFNGCAAAILLPHILFSAYSLQYEWLTIYALYTGWVGKEAIYRYASLDVERQFDALRDEFGDDISLAVVARKDEPVNSEKSSGSDSEHSS